MGPAQVLLLPSDGARKNFKGGRKIKERRADIHGRDGDGVRWRPCLRTRHAWNRPPRPSSSASLGQSAAPTETVPTEVFWWSWSWSYFKKCLVQRLQSFRIMVAAEATIFCFSRVGKAILRLIHGPHNEIILKMTLWQWWSRWGSCVKLALRMLFCLLVVVVSCAIYWILIESVTWATGH